MKLLMIYTSEFSYSTSQKALKNIEDLNEQRSYKNIQLIFIHVEEHDKLEKKEVENKAVKNIKWILRKNNTKNVILHSFVHLSDSKADLNTTQELLNRIEQRLRHAGYNVYQTPFGYFLNLEIKAPGFSLARVYKDF